MNWKLGLELFIYTPYCVFSDSQQALELLEQLQERLSKGDDTPDEDLSNLIYLLDSPLFVQLANIQDSITQLKQVTCMSHMEQKQIHPNRFNLRAIQKCQRFPLINEILFHKRGRGFSKTLKSHKFLKLYFYVYYMLCSGTLYSSIAWLKPGHIQMV